MPAGRLSALHPFPARRLSAWHRTPPGTTVLGGFSFSGFSFFVFLFSDFSFYGVFFPHWGHRPPNKPAPNEKPPLK